MADKKIVAAGSRDTMQAMQALGMSAMTYATKLTEMAARCAASGIDPSAIMHEGREQMYQLVRAAIACTMRIMTDCNGGDQDVCEMVREMEEKMIAWIDHGPKTESEPS